MHPRLSIWSRAVFIVLVPLLLFSGGTASAQSAIEVEAMLWLESADDWYSDAFFPFYAGLFDNDARRGLQSRDMMVGEALIADFPSRYARVAGAYFAHIQEFFGDTGVRQRLSSATRGTPLGSRVSKLQSALDAAQSRNEVAFSLVSEVRDGAISVWDFRMGIQIVYLWDDQRMFYVSEYLAD